MYEIDAKQIKAARALLDWSQEDLAKHANLSVTTIRTMELGNVPKDKTLDKVYKTLDFAGVELTEGDGVRLRAEGIRTLRGENACERLFESVQEAIETFDDEIFVQILSAEAWLQPNGQVSKTNLQRLEQLAKTTHIKCFLTEKVKLPFYPASMKIQHLPDISASPLANCSLIYGNKCASIQMISRMDFLIVEIQIPSAILRYREKYLSLWNKVSSLK